MSARQLLVLVAGTVAIACGGATSDGGFSGSTGDRGSTSSSSGTVPSGQSPSCDASGVVNLAVASDDPNGYPPYAVAECTLVYVTGAGALVLRDLVTSAETTLEEPQAQAKARRPSISMDAGANGESTPVIAWESLPTTPGQASPPSVRVRYGRTGATTTLRGDFVGSSEPRVSGYRVAFTAWKGPTENDDMDVWMYDVRTSSARMVIGGSGQQRFADISATHVAASDFSEDPDGRYDRDEKDLADIVLFEITTSGLSKRALPGKQAFPMLTDNGLLAYLAWSGVHPEPKFQAYDLKAGPLVVADPASDRTIAHVEYVTAEPVRPSVIGGVVEWVDNPTGQTSLHRASVDGAEPPARVSGLDNLQLYAPAGNRSFTILATIDTRPANPDRTPRLKTITR